MCRTAVRLAVIALVLAFPATSFAIRFCVGSPAQCGFPLEIATGASGVSIPLWFQTEADLSTMYGGSVTGTGPTAFQGIAAGPDAASTGGCTFSGAPGQTASWSCGDGGTIPAGGSYHFATLTVDAGGYWDSVILTGGTYVSAGSGDQSVDNLGQILVMFVPESSTHLLLAFGLAGLAVMRRRHLNA
jgi:hypothetical protein